MPHGSVKIEGLPFPCGVRNSAISNSQTAKGEGIVVFTGVQKAYFCFPLVDMLPHSNYNWKNGGALTGGKRFI
jgi:hypothetical protein